MDTRPTPVHSTSHEFAPGLHIDIVRPPDSNVTRPVIVWLHGGAWRMQDRSARPNLLQHFAVHGYVMASIDYRLTPQTRHPSQLSDVRSAVRWIRTHAGALGATPDRIGLWGSSAGGHLAALTGLTSPALVQAVVDGYGPADLTSAAAGSPEAELLGGPAHQRPAVARNASPALQVGQTAPPFLIMHGRADNMVPAEQSIALYDALADRGHNAMLYLIDGFGHGFFNPGDVLELGPGQTLDQGHLERDPCAPADVFATPALQAFADRHPHASLTAIEAFFAHTLKDPS